MLFLFQSLISQGQYLFTHSNQLIEWNYHSSKLYSDPFNEVNLWAEITNESGEIKKLPAFWARENMWSFRFSCPTRRRNTVFLAGRFMVACNDQAVYMV